MPRAGAVHLIRLGNSAMSAQCPVSPKADMPGLFMSTPPSPWITKASRSTQGTHRGGRHIALPPLISSAVYGLITKAYRDVLQLGLAVRVKRVEFGRTTGQ